MTLTKITALLLIKNVSYSCQIGAETFSTITFRITTLSIMDLIVTLSIMTLGISISVFALNVVQWHVLFIAMLSAIRLNVVMLIVLAAPRFHLPCLLG